MSHPASQVLLPGTEIAGYRIERELGRGSMAVVYRAIQLNLQRPVALKVLSPELAGNQEFVGRFFNEARAAAALSHANIIQAYDAGLADDAIYYFAMEYVEGETVQDRIAREGPMPPRTALRMATDIADALDYGWQRQRLTHGDIKPDNIMINTEGETKLADFGLAKVDEHDFAGTGVMLTPLYASPEAILGKLEKGDCRGDIYSFGATLYHMLSGHPPFPGSETEAVLERHLHEELTPLSAVVADLPPGVSSLVGDLLAKNPEDRPQDWHAVRTALQDLGKSKARPAPKMRMNTSSSRKVAVAAAAPRRGAPPALVCVLAMTMLVAAVALVLVIRDSGAAPPPPHPLQSQPALPPAPVSHPPAKQPVTEPPAPPAPRVDQDARLRVQKLWDELQERLRTSEDDPEKCAGELRGFADAHRDVWLPPDLDVRLKDFETAAAWRAAAARENPPAPDPGEEGKGTAPEESAARQAESRDLPLSRETQREEDFVRLAAALRAYSYRPGVSVDPLVRMASAWLASYPEESDRHPLVRLVAESFLPALDECVAKLVANQADLLGKPILLSKKQEGTVHELSLERLSVNTKTPHGYLREGVAWRDLRDPSTLLMLCHHAFGREGTSLADRRSYLALALISRDEKWWNAATAGLQESPELRHWRRFRTEYERALYEGQALALWDRARKAFAEGNDAEAYWLARELRGKRSDVATRHQADLERIERICAEAVPEVRAGRLVREVQEAVRTTPLQSLQTLNLVHARYGALDFPERERMADLREQALAAVAPRERAPAADRRSLLYDFCNQTSGAWGSPPHAAMLALRNLLADADRSRYGQSSESFASLIALTELGDWAGAAKRMAECPAKLPARPPDFAACAAFAMGLVGERFPSSRKPDFDPLKELDAIVAQQRDRGDQRARLATLRCDFALVAQRSAELPLSALLAEAVQPPPFSDSADFALSSLAVHLEAGRQTEAASLLAAFRLDPSRLAAYRFTRAQGDLLQAAGDFIQNGTPFDPATMELPFSNHERLFRFAVSALCTHPAKVGDCPDLLAAQIESLAPGLGPVGGNALYDLVCLRVATALRQKDLARAQQAADWGLAQTCTALFPYYPRLLFIKVGLNRIGGDTGKQESIGQMLRATTVANHTERALASLLDPGYPARRAVEAIRKHEARNARFWFEWLQRSLEIAQAPAPERAKLASSIYDRECSPAERLLSQGLARFHLP